MLLRETREYEVGRVLDLEANPGAAPFILRWSESEHRSALSDPDQAHLALERDGDFVGFVLLAGVRSPHHSVELRRIIVSPPGQGLGADALDLVLAYAFEQLNAHRVWLDVKTNNHRAQRAYQRAGFIQEGVLRDALFTNGAHESLIVMSILAADRAAIKQGHKRSLLGDQKASHPGSRGEPQVATRDDFVEIVSSLPAFWGERDVRHLHHPSTIEEFGDSALVIRDDDGRVAAYLFGMILDRNHLGYVHVVAVRDDHRGTGLARKLYGVFAEMATMRGCTSIKAITTASNTGSIAFHESIGMDGHEVQDYAGPGQPRVVLSHNLTAAPLPAASPTGTTLRYATAQDTHELLSFWQLAAEDSDRPADRPEAIRGLMARDPKAVLLAKREGEIVACLIIGWDGWRAHLYRLAVHPAHRRQGLARLLLDAAERRLQATTAIRIDAMVLDSNDQAHAVWAKAGYARQANWSRWVRSLTE